MRTYLEAMESSALPETEPDFLRIDITGYTEAEISGIKSEIASVMDSVPYDLTRHYCYHDEGGSCTRQTEPQL